MENIIKSIDGVYSVSSEGKFYKNRVENLRWVSQKENCNNPLTRKHQTEWIRTEETRKKMSEAKKGIPNFKKCKPVLQYTKEGEFVREWQSTQQIQREMGFIQANICSCCLNKRKSANGFIWKYKEIA